ncbi:hypothetical protein AJ80_06118 [Polytolypa hystricis UAMH7299]|uniref:Cutinase n=1 Tax=Polytolypa hystricis (strain UAMH7299) TaxID=1447883 RepID=A0A2B7XZI4_POLH7|nr:hypothetical protein AJ80_06118 [Polytolypa hystricis UAMH7299]
MPKTSSNHSINLNRPTPCENQTNAPIPSYYQDVFHEITRHSSLRHELCSGDPLPSKPRYEKRQSCAPVHIITARASTERAGEGIIGSVASNIVRANPGTTRDSVDYPALLFPYASSSSQGVSALTEQLTDFVNQCPDSKVVLLGYSQGAHVIGDTLCGGGGVAGIGSATPPISTEVSDKVAAIIMMGDPRHIVDAPFNVGTSRKDGLFPRLDPQSCDSFADRMQSFCDSGDTFCDSGFNTLVHLGYVTKYGNQAAAFVNGKI